MSLPKSIVAVREFIRDEKDVLNLLHLFEGKISGRVAICGVGGVPHKWQIVDKGKWDRPPNRRCNLCERSLRKRERAALREKA